MPFSIGVVSLGLAVLALVMYLLGRQVRRFIAWMNGAEPPRERPVPYSVLFFIVGFVLGSFLQPPWDRGVQCREAGRPVVSCIFFQGTTR
jgi:hypothetical protein